MRLGLHRVAVCLRQQGGFVARDWLFWGTFLALFLKTLMFLLLLRSFDADKIFAVRAGALLEEYGWPDIVGGGNAHLLVIDIGRWLLHLGVTGLLLAPALLLRRHGRIAYLLLANLGVSALLAGDLLYYTSFGGLLSARMFNQAANLWAVKDALLDRSYLVWLWGIADALLLAAIALCRRSYSAPRQPLAFAVLLLAGVCSVCLHNSIARRVFEATHFEFPRMFVGFYDNKRTVRVLSPLGHHLSDLWLWWRTPVLRQLSPEQCDRIARWYADHQEPLPPGPDAGRFRGRNLIVVQLESFERFLVELEINDQPVTPNLSRLLAHSYYFTSLYHQVHGGGTSDAHFMTNTSLYPLPNEAVFSWYADNRYVSLPLLLRAQGYHTIALVPDSATLWNWKRAMQSIGFERVIDKSRLTVERETNGYLCDASLFRQAGDLAVGLRRPFYLFLATVGMHTPFDLPDADRELRLPAHLRDTHLDDYLQMAHDTDRQIGRFVDRLEQAGLLKDTLMVFYGDHGGIHRYFYPELAEIEPREDWWWKYDLKVPFILYHPSLEGKKLPVHGGQVDIMPTLAALLGVPAERLADSAMGRDLLNTHRDCTLDTGGDVAGQPADEAEKKHTRAGPTVAEWLIRSNYFRDRAAALLPAATDAASPPGDQKPAGRLLPVPAPQ